MHTKVSDLWEYGTFLQSLRVLIHTHGLKSGEDVQKFASSHKLQVPKGLKGAPLTYLSRTIGRPKPGKIVAKLTFHHVKNAPKPDVLDLKVICIRRCPARNDCYNICLECSWSSSLGFYCTITISQAN